MLPNPNEPTQASVESRTADPRARPEPQPCIDLDRFCADCGYNLRTLPVSCDARTGIPVVRCPECGRFQSANEASTVLQPWLRRATSLLLGIWILAVIAIVVLLVTAEMTVSYETLDELTVSGNLRTQRINGTTVRIWSESGPVAVDADYRGYKPFVASVLMASFLSAFALGLFAVIVLPHWRRGAYVGLALVLPLVVAVVVAIAWSYEAPHLLHWALAYVAAHAAAQLVGGMAGITFARPLARLTVQIMLPPGVRPRLAYLWLADGKPLPRP